MSFTAPLDTLTAPAELVVPPRRKGTLLIVDDEDGPRQSLRVIFKDDYEILMASDGPSAITLAQNQKIDVAVLAVRLGRVSGHEGLAWLKNGGPAIRMGLVYPLHAPDTIR